MAKTLEQILGYVYLTGLVEDVKTGVPKVLPNAFWDVKTETVRDQGRYTRYSGTRKNARRVEYGSPGFRRELSEIGSFDVKLIHTHEFISLKPTDYVSLREYAAYGKQNMGSQEVQRQAQQHKALFTNSRISAVCSMLRFGAIYFDANGHLLPSSSGATVTVDYNISANNQNQLNSIITASWATAGTDILLQLINLHKRSIQLTGYPLKYAFYGEKIPSYFATNTIMKEYLVRNPSYNEYYMSTGEIPKGLGGFEWIPAYKAFFTDPDGTNQEWWGDDTVVFTPEIDSSVYEFMEGTFPVPTSYAVTEMLKGAFASFMEKLGMASFALPRFEGNLSADVHYVDTFLPIWKIPDTLFIADVTP